MKNNIEISGSKTAVNKITSKLKNLYSNISLKFKKSNSNSNNNDKKIKLDLNFLKFVQLHKIR